MVSDKEMEIIGKYVKELANRSAFITSDLEFEVKIDSMGSTYNYIFTINKFEICRYRESSDEFQKKYHKVVYNKFNGNQIIELLDKLYNHFEEIEKQRYESTLEKIDKLLVDKKQNFVKRYLKKLL